MSCSAQGPCPCPKAMNLNFIFMFISSLNAWMSPWGSEPGERINIIGRVGLDWWNMRRYSSTGGWTSFSPSIPATKSLTALYTRSNVFKKKGEYELFIVRRNFRSITKRKRKRKECRNKLMNGTSWRSRETLHTDIHKEYAVKYCVYSTIRNVL